ncbi:permease [bacterium]|nr:permease [bacterium]
MRLETKNNNKERKENKNYGAWIFFISIIFLYLFLLIFNFNLFKKAVFGLAGLLYHIIPVFILVFIFMFLINLFLDVKKVIRFLGKDAGFKGWIISIIGGILSSGPVYVWYPMLENLRRKGMRDSFIVAFLYNRAVKIALLPMMIYYFGLPFTIIISFYMILFSIIDGIIVEKLIRLKA